MTNFDRPWQTISGKGQGVMLLPIVGFDMKLTIIHCGQFLISTAYRVFLRRRR